MVLFGKVPVTQFSAGYGIGATVLVSPSPGRVNRSSCLANKAATEKCSTKLSEGTCNVSSDGGALLLKLVVYTTQVCAQCGQSTFVSVHPALASTLQMHTTHTRLARTGLCLGASWHTEGSRFSSPPPHTQRDLHPVVVHVTLPTPSDISIDGSDLEPI